MMIPEDGYFRAITPSHSNAFNNIMVVKVNNLENPGESTYQLATLDRSIKGTVWPADNYISKLIPGLPENQICDEHIKASKPKKELNLSIKTTTIRPKLFRQPDRDKYHFTETDKPSFEMNDSSDRSENFNKFHSKPENDNIKPELQKAWNNQHCVLPNGNRNILPLASSEGHFNLSTKDLRGFSPLGDHHNLPGAPPSSNSSFQNFNPQNHSPNFNSYNNYRQNSRNRPNSSRCYKKNYPRNASSCGSRHDSSLVEPYNSYMEAERNNSDPNFMHEHGFSASNNSGRSSYIFPRENHIPYSRHDSPHSSFKANYIDQEMDDSVAYNNVGMHSNASYQTQYCAQNNQRQNWRNKTKFWENRNSAQRYNYNKNKKKHSMANNHQNFKQSGYRGNN